MQDAGASINTLPSWITPKTLESYPGVINRAEDKPCGNCRLRVVNPKNVPFVVFEGDRLPHLSYKISLQINIVQINDENFDISTVTTNIYPNVFERKLGSLPGIQKLWIKPDHSKQKITHIHPSHVKTGARQACEDGCNRTSGGAHTMGKPDSPHAQEIWWSSSLPRPTQAQ